MEDIEITVPETTGQTTTEPVPEKDNPTEPTAPDTIVSDVPQEPAVQGEMSSPETAVQSATSLFGSAGPKPFVIALHLRPTSKAQHFTPAATVQIDPSLRTSGLLAALPAEEVKTLVALLTFLSPNGDIKPTAGEVAEGLHVSEGKAKERLSRLSRFRWQSRPVVATLWRETGMDGYTVVPEMISYRQIGPEHAQSSPPAFRAAGRDAVIAASRTKYARPRAEVEREIAMLNGWPLPDLGDDPANTSPQEYLLQRLLRLGVTAEQAGILLETCPIEEIEQQLEWLPYRGAKNPASYLVAAITGRYEEPTLLRLRREQQAYDPDVSPVDRSEQPGEEVS